MIKCRFIYRFADGGKSDSLNFVYRVQAVPRVGETLAFTNEGEAEVSGSVSQEGATVSVVREIVHEINTVSGAHEIVVYYGP